MATALQIYKVAYSDPGWIILAENRLKNRWRFAQDNRRGFDEQTQKPTR
jgi:hypothetical protein